MNLIDTLQQKKLGMIPIILVFMPLFSHLVLWVGGSAIGRVVLKKNVYPFAIIL
jgi:hypothetical protein